MNKKTLLTLFSFSLFGVNITAPMAWSWYSTCRGSCQAEDAKKWVATIKEQQEQGVAIQLEEEALKCLGTDCDDLDAVDETVTAFLEGLSPENLTTPVLRYLINDLRFVEKLRKDAEKLKSLQDGLNDNGKNNLLRILAHADKNHNYISKEAAIEQTDRARQQAEEQRRLLEADAEKSERARLDAEKALREAKESTSRRRL